MQESFSCRIQNHIFRKDKVYYYILIINNKTGSIRQLKLRYSECKKLHEKIQKIVSKYKLQVYLPVFPGRKMFGSTNKDETNILQRRVELTYYYNELLTIQKLHSLEQFQEVILPPKIDITQQQQKIDSTEQGEASNTFMNLTNFDDEDMEDFEMRAPTEGGNIRVKIDRYQVAEDVVNYFITFFDMNQKKDWTFKSRYSEIRALNEALSGQKKIKQYVPNFPKRKLFGITNENPEDIEKRREQLEQFLNQLYSKDEVVNNDVAKFFLQDGKRQADIIKQKEQNSQRKRRMRMLKHKQEEIIQQVITKQGDTKKLMQEGQQLQEKQQELIDNIQQDLMKISKKKKKKFKIQHLDRVQEVHSRYESDDYFSDTQKSRMNNLKKEMKIEQQQQKQELIKNNSLEKNKNTTQQKISQSDSQQNSNSSQNQNIQKQNQYEEEEKKNYEENNNLQDLNTQQIIQQTENLQINENQDENNSNNQQIQQEQYQEQLIQQQQNQQLLQQQNNNSNQLEQNNNTNDQLIESCDS